MPDITMCDNKECLKAKNCYRFMAMPSEYRQSYSHFVPNPNTELNFKCGYFMTIGSKPVSSEGFAPTT